MRQPRHPRARGESLRSTSLRMSPTSLGPCCAAEPLLNAFVIFFYIYTDTKHCLAQAQGHIDNGTFIPYAIGAVLRCLTTAPLLPTGEKKSGRNSDDGNFCRKGRRGCKGEQDGMTGTGKSHLGTGGAPHPQESTQQTDTQQTEKTRCCIKKNHPGTKKRRMGFLKIPFAPFLSPRRVT